MRKKGNRTARLHGIEMADIARQTLILKSDGTLEKSWSNTLQYQKRNDCCGKIHIFCTKEILLMLDVSNIVISVDMSENDQSFTD